MFRNNQVMYILQKNRSNLVNFGLGSLISDLQTAIGGHHPVLYFKTQITEKYSTAMCYRWHPVSPGFGFGGPLLAPH